MLARLLAVAIATASMLLAGCQTVTTKRFLAPEARDQTHYRCSDADLCYVLVDPDKPQWLPENIDVYKGKKLVLWINNVAAFQDVPVTMKPDTPPILDCGEKAKLLVRCKVSDGAVSGTKYGYTINVKDAVTGTNYPPYDPFVWPN